MENRRIRFGVVGLGMMGKEFAGAAARWMQLQQEIPCPEIVGVCSATQKSRDWFTQRLPGVKYSVQDYRELLDKPDIDAVYVAVPHSMHEQVCIHALRAGKHVICEKPFGIDREANLKIYEEAAKHPELLVRCASQMIYFPGARAVLDWFRRAQYGRILQIKVGFKHESDINPLKPINWKRQKALNGEYGVLGDLAPHSLLLPLRAGVVPDTVYSILSNIITQRPDGAGGMTPCDTWDNAILLMNAHMQGEDYSFPMVLEAARIAPGSPNDWYIEVYGSEASIRFSLSDTNNIYYAERDGGSQRWVKQEIGYQPFYPTITGGLAAFGFGDSLLQMWAAYLDELAGGETTEHCMTPDEALLCHGVLDGALRAHASGEAVPVQRG